MRKSLGLADLAAAQECRRLQQINCRSLCIHSRQVHSSWHPRTPEDPHICACQGPWIQGHKSNEQVERRHQWPSSYLMSVFTWVLSFNRRVKTHPIFVWKTNFLKNLLYCFSSFLVALSDLYFLCLLSFGCFSVSNFLRFNTGSSFYNVGVYYYNFVSESCFCTVPFIYLKDSMISPFGFFFDTFIAEENSI